MKVPFNTVIILIVGMHTVMGILRVRAGSVWSSSIAKVNQDKGYNTENYMSLESVSLFDFTCPQELLVVQSSGTAFYFCPWITTSFP